MHPCRKDTHVDVARRNALRLLKLVNTLLDFSRIEAGRVQAVFEPTDLGTFTSEIASGFRSAMEKAGLRFSVQCESISEPVYVDRDMWEKIVLNLLSNAFKFTLEGEIAVSLKAADGSAELAVRDTGVGISPEEQPRVFERFHRVENVRSRSYEGTGIGLALVHELVRLHGGSVRLESELGRGSVFTVTIPLGTSHLPANHVGADRKLVSTALAADAYVQEASRWLPNGSATPTEEMEASRLSDANARPAIETGDVQKEVVVIADDNRDMRDYLARLLQEQYDVHSVPDGKQALEAVRTLHPSLVLADVMMPALDGFGLVNEIRAEESLRSTPVILLSARAGEESRIEGLQAGADDYLVKPFTARELIARVSMHLKMAKIRREAADRETQLRALAEVERQRLQDLMAQAPAAIGLTTGPEHRWVYVNENYVRVTGRRSASDFVGKTLRESLPEIETQPFIGLLDEVYRTGEPFFGHEMKAMLRRSAAGDLEAAYFDFVYQPIRDADRNVEGILVHAVEVTDKVTARQAVQAAADRLLLAQTAAQIGTWEWDPVQNTRRLSKELHRLFGTEATDPEHAAKWAERVFPSDWGKVQQCMAEAVRSGEMDFEYRYQHPELGLRWFYCKGRRFEDESRMFGIVQDITDRKRAELALIESEQKLKVVTEATPVMIWMSGLDKLCYYFNKSWLDFVGRSLEQEIGNGWAENVHPDDFERCLQIYVTSFDARQPFEMEYRLRHHSGEYRWILDHGVPRYAPNGAFEGYVGGCLDIQDQHEAAEKVRRAAEEVNRSKGQLEMALAASDTGTFRWDLQTDIVEIDDSLERLLGRGQNEGIRTLRDLRGRVHPEDRVRVDFALDACRAGADFEMEFRVLVANDSLRWLYGRGKAQFQGDQGRCMVGALTDITSRKSAEESLRESELWLAGQKQAFQAAVNGAPLAESLEVLIRTATKHFRSEARCAFYIANKAGTELRHVAGMPADHAECVDGFRIGPDSLACGLAVHTGEPRITLDVREDPLWKPWLWLAERFDYRGCWSFPLKTSAGKAIGTFAMYFREPRDVTARDLQLANVLTNAAAIIISKHQEAEERAITERARRRLATIVESSGDAIVSKDLNGVITSWNRQAEKLFGYTEKEIVGRSILTLIPPELHKDEEIILGKIRSGEAIDHFETVRISKSGERIDVSLSISPVRDENGNIIGAAKIVRDIRENKKVERALRTTEKLAAAGRLAATVAHEVNNPLEAVTNLIYLAERNLPAGADRAAAQLSLARGEVDRVAHITRQTLAFYRDSTSPQRMDIGEAIDGLLRVYETKLMSRGIRILKELGEGLELKAFAGEIQQAISNLLANAIDAMPSGGLLRLRVRKAHLNNKSPRIHGVRITIADTGCGIEAEHRNNIFEPFFTTKKDVGTGLGLWITRGIVEKHKGTIQLRSRPGAQAHGTVFSMFIPADGNSLLAASRNELSSPLQENLIN